jgi:hypothetical protein
MLYKTSELTDTALDWAVGVAEGYELSLYGVDPSIRAKVPGFDGTYTPSTNWSQGGPIIERKIVSIDKEEGGKRWAAFAWRSDRDLQKSIGPTPLIAAMRCYVASKLGDEVEVPDELITQ